jgi:stress-induced morphogen
VSDAVQIELEIRTRLATLAPLALDLTDESHLHAGHAGRAAAAGTTGSTSSPTLSPGGARWNATGSSTLRWAT